MTKAPTTGINPCDFANPEIAPDSLPVAENVAWRPLHPRYARRLLAGALIRMLVVGVIGATVHVAVASGAVPASLRVAPWLFFAAWTIYAAFLLRGLLWPIVATPRRGYALRDKDVLYRSGVFWRSAWAVPFNRVQHMQIDSTPLDRRFGLASLAVFPAGGGAQKIPGLGEAMAERLRAFVSARIGEEPGLNMETGATDRTSDDPS